MKKINLLFLLTIILAIIFTISGTADSATDCYSCRLGDTSNPYARERCESYIEYCLESQRMSSQFGDYMYNSFQNLNPANSCSSSQIYSNGKCITLDQSCKENYGKYSYFITDGNYTCNCLSGYEFKNHYCVKKVITSCPDGYILSGNNCISHAENCKNSYGQNVYGIKGDNNKSSCYCSTGYKWNFSKTACIKKEIVISPEIKGVDDILIPEGAIIKTANNPDIYIVKYVVTKKFKQLILNPSVFNNYEHLRWEDVMDVSQSTLNSFTTSELVRAVGDDKIYRLYAQGDIGQKRMIKK